MPQVSVVIPAYNPGLFLRRSLDSVLAQSLTDLECIVVDDGSSEDLDWVRTHPDNRVSLIRQPNRGVSVARNIGATLASGLFVAFLDQDDEWLPDKLSRQMEAYSHRPGAAFAYTGFTWVLPTGRVEARAAQVTYHGLLRGAQHICLSSLLVPRDHYWAVGGHSPLLAQQQDFDLFLRLMRVVGDPVPVPDALVRYHVHGQNASTDYETAVREARGVLAAHRLRSLRTGDSAAAAAATAGLANAERLYGYQAIDAARNAWRSGEHVAALAHARRALGLSPSALFRTVTGHLGGPTSPT